MHGIVVWSEKGCQGTTKVPKRTPRDIINIKKTLKDIGKDFFQVVDHVK
jgi:hypothetical protein